LRSRAPSLIVGGLIGIVIGVALILGLQWLTSAGAPVPTSSSVAGASGGPTPSRASVGLPDHDRTPGSINGAATQANIDVTVCMPGWAKSVRPPSAYTGALKITQILEYGYGDKNPLHYQEDHLVPLELGGAPRDPRNLWPQPNTVTLPDGTPVGSKEKDDLEDVLHDRVCARAMTLEDAQRAMADDWIAAWQAAGRP
jgi:hypothetical protein